MKVIMFFLALNYFCVDLFAQHCKVENVILETEIVNYKRKFLFWRLPHKKNIVIDKVLDSDGHLIIESKSIFISSDDASEDRRFRRLKIKNNEIWKFYSNRKSSKSKIYRYNFCGKYLGEKKWEDGDFYEIERLNLAK